MALRAERHARAEVAALIYGIIFSNCINSWLENNPSKYAAVRTGQFNIGQANPFREIVERLSNYEFKMLRSTRTKSTTTETLVSSNDIVASAEEVLCVTMPDVFVCLDFPPMH